ncbi:MAG: hypothetical protein GOP50_12975 [Candidatus Heimdallarchaeota archaeon]|nr:hypothetical protein [Candidatus Heimdallarchaeota archaeon]
MNLSRESKKYLVILISLIIVIGGLMEVNLNTIALNSDNEPPSYSHSDLLEFEGITINNENNALIKISNDENFTDYGFSGIGTAEEPYRIENLSIETNNDIGIFIENTTKFFVIENCTIEAIYCAIYIFNIAEGTALIENNTLSGIFYHDIFLESSSSLEVINNICYGSDYYSPAPFEVLNSGIKLERSHNTKVLNNNCSSNMYGIHVFSSLNVTIENCACVENIKCGIRSDYSDDLIISDTHCYSNNIGISIKSSSFNLITFNFCFHNTIGIEVYYSQNLNIENNTCENNEVYGIEISHSTRTNLRNNELYNDSIILNEDWITEYFTYELENNYVNDKIVGFFIYEEDLDISTSIYGQIIMIGCNNITIRNQNVRNINAFLFFEHCYEVTITDNEFGYSSVSVVHIDNGCEILITNNTFISNLFGSEVKNSYFVTIENNLFENNVYSGIFLRGSEHVNIQNNQISNTRDYGILIDDAQNIVVKDNMCRENGAGIVCWGSVDLHITNNILDTNVIGVSTLDCCGVFISENTCINNRRGIVLSISCYYFTISYNLLQNNSEYGIEISRSSQYNTIHHNSFLDNNMGRQSQALDDGEYNIWYEVETKEGNYWSSWNSKEPYLIEGEAGSEDLYPLNEELDKISYSYWLGLPILIILTIGMKRLKKKRK